MIKRVYKVVTTDKPDWDKIPKAYIDVFPWGGYYKPVSYGQVAFVPGQGFAVRLTSFESEPLAIYTEYGEPVYRDSALEFFVAFNNKLPYYVNFETNSNGALLAARRTCREDKVPLDKLIDINKIRIKARREYDRWYVEYMIPLDVIQELFKKSKFPSGYVFHGNFYKCGDDTEFPHHGVFESPGTAMPDFHRPENFAELIME